jgi:hypothetical protein
LLNFDDGVEMTAGTAALNATRGCAVAVIIAGLLLVSPAAAQSISDKLNSWFFGGPAQDKANPANANTPAEIDCPGVEVRQGASTLAINTPGAEAGPMTTRYQVTIGQTARECAALGGVMTMKVGVQGRVLLGPAGGPGQVDIPLRLAVVQEGPEPKPIIGKFARLSVTVPPGQTTVPFVHVEQDLTFPMPRGKLLEAYVVYVGFDPAPAKPERKQRQPQKHK